MLICKFKKNDEEINVDEIEKKIGYSFPNQYICFLQKYNGGETPDTNWMGKVKSDIQGFFGYKVDNTIFDIENIIKYLIVQELIDKKKFPVAKNCFGDYFCLDCIDGSIWFIYHDSFKCNKIANDFISFISGCKSKKIGYIRTIEERTKRRFEVTGELPSEKIVEAWKKEIEYYSNLKQEKVIL